MIYKYTFMNHKFIFHEVYWFQLKSIIKGIFVKK